MGIVMFNGISSLDYGIQVEHPPEYQAPARDYEVIHVPGRNGDLVIDNGSYQNVNRSYQMAIGDPQKDYTSMANVISEWLHSASGYARLEDSYEPEYYRMAMFQDEISIENIMQHAGRLTIDFNCKPQRFLKSGEEFVKITRQTTLYNPTGFNSLPCITVYGNGRGVLSIGMYTITISNINGSITLDSEIQDAYKGTVNRNADVTLNKNFPEFISGENNIAWSGGITYLEVIPRWWTL